MDYITIGSSPWGESCVQLGEENYKERAIAECERFIKLIELELGKPPVGTELSIRGFEHDFGRYYEVSVEYNPNDEESRQYARYIESNIPETW